MPDSRFLPGLVLVGSVAVLAVVALVAMGLSRPGLRRAGLVAGALPLGLLPPVAATAYVSAKLVGLFSGMADARPGSARLLLDGCASLWLLQRVAWGAFFVCCVVGLVLGLLRFGKPADDAPCSPRRGFVLVLLPLLGLLVAGSLTHQLARAMRVTVAVVSPEEGDTAARERADAVLEAHGLPTRGSGSIAATARFIARATMIGLFGGLSAMVLLLGLALPGFILAWRVRFGASFTALASAVWLLTAAGAAVVALGGLDPLRLP
jgi:hypothetical protein